MALRASETAAFWASICLFISAIFWSRFCSRSGSCASAAETWGEIGAEGGEILLHLGELPLGSSKGLANPQGTRAPRGLDARGGLGCGHLGRR